MKCPGLYCGMMPLANDTLSDCGACDRGWKRDDKFICHPCEDSLILYDWLFLIFSCIVPLLIHSFLIDHTAQQRKFVFRMISWQLKNSKCSSFFRFSKEIIFLYSSALLEIAGAALLTVFLSDPMFSFDIHSCGVSGLSDWYTFLYNPSPRYESTMICTAERVFPLQTMVLIFYVFCVTFMLLLRPFVNEKCKEKIEKAPLAVYYALYAIPLLALIHALFGGLVYFAFPYLSIVISCGANATHFAMKLDQTTKTLLITSVTDFRNIIIICKLYQLHADWWQTN